MYCILDGTLAELLSSSQVLIVRTWSRSLDQVQQTPENLLVFNHRGSKPLLLIKTPLRGTKVNGDNHIRCISLVH